MPDPAPSRTRGPSRPDGLGPPGAILRRQLGDNVFNAWFDGVTIKSETAVLITLAAPTKFKASRIKQEFEIQTLAAWRTMRPSIERIDVVCAA
jgi:DnaA N-terminal domain